MPNRAHPGVDAYIAGLSPWQQDICTALREVVWEADPDIEETIKRSVQPYFVLNGNVCALLATKDHINLFLYDPTVADPAGIINQGRENKTACAIQIFRGDGAQPRGADRDVEEHREQQPCRRLAANQAGRRLTPVADREPNRHNRRCAPLRRENLPVSGG